MEMRKRLLLRLSVITISHHAIAVDDDKLIETYSIHGRATIVPQLQNGFAAQYSRQNSLVDHRE